jgi:uncharacterized protein YbbK (DUF523 family)
MIIHKKNQHTTTNYHPPDSAVRPDSAFAPGALETALNHNPRVGISQCLLGDEVRYDGGHKRDVFLTDVLAPFVEWVPVCPEVEAGLGTPREAMHLAGDPDSPRLLTIRTKIDHTDVLKAFSQRRVQELRQHDLDGYIFKKNSPSCGVHRVKVYSEKGHPGKQGTGIFSAAMQEAFPLLPVEEEGRLTNEYFVIGDGKLRSSNNASAVEPSWNFTHGTNIYCSLTAVPTITTLSCSSRKPASTPRAT